MQLSAAGLEF